MTDASPALPPARQVQPGTRRMLIFAGVLDLIIAVLVLLIAAAASKMIDSGKGGAGLEILIAFLFFACPPALARYLYTSTSVDVRWIGALVWGPVILAIVGTFLSIQFA